MQNTTFEGIDSQRHFNFGNTAETTPNQPIVFKFSTLKSIPKFNLFVYINQDFYRKVFFHKFHSFQTFKDQLDVLNDNPTYAYEYTGTLLDDVNSTKFNFTHLFFDYFYPTREGSDSNIELGVSVYVENETNANNLPDYDSLKWIPFCDINKPYITSYTDEDSLMFTGHDARTSLKTYPDFYNTINNEKTFNKQWLQYFRVDDTAQIQLAQGVNPSIIESIYLYAHTLDQPFPSLVDYCNYITTKLAEAKVTNYNEVMAITTANTWSEINFLNTVNKTQGFQAGVGKPVTVECAWQVKSVNGRTVIAICPSNSEQNIVHERDPKTGELYAINIPSENIYRGSDQYWPTSEKISIALKRNVHIKGDVLPPTSYFATQTTEQGTWGDLDVLTPTAYAEQQMPYGGTDTLPDLNEYFKTLTAAEIASFVATQYMGKLFVCGKTDMRAKPYDPDRSSTGYDWTNKDSDDYVALDEIAFDLHRRALAYIAAGNTPGVESATYPFLDSLGKLSYGIFSKFEIQSDWYAGIVIGAEVTSDDNGDYVLELQLNAVSKTDLDQYTSPLGWIYGESKLDLSGAFPYYDNFNFDGTHISSVGEFNSISKYMKSFRFFDLSITDGFTPNYTVDNDIETDNLDYMRRFTCQDIGGALCPTLSNLFYYNYDTYKNTVDKSVRSNVNKEDLATSVMPMTDWQVYFGIFGGLGLWQKGLEIIYDAKFELFPSFRSWFTSEANFINEYSFISNQRLLDDFDFTNATLPVSVIQDTHYNGMSVNAGREQGEIEVSDINLMFFVPYAENQAREKYWMQQQLQHLTGETTFPFFNAPTLENLKVTFPSIVLYQEDARDEHGDEYVKDYHNDGFDTVIERLAVGSEEGVEYLDWIYLYRPVRHSIKLNNTLFTTAGYKFDVQYVWMNNVDETDKLNYRDTELTVDYDEDSFAIEYLRSRKQTFGTYYYELSESGIQLILPNHDLYDYTIIDLTDPNSVPTFFRTDESICLGAKIFCNNKDSVEIIEPTIQEITLGVSNWNNAFRGVNETTVPNDCVSDMKAPYGDLWIALGDINRTDSEIGYGIVNHSYVRPADCGIKTSMIVDKKSWRNLIDTSYVYLKPTIAHFFIDEDNEVKYMLSISTVDTIKKQFGKNVVYLGSAIIPPPDFFNLNKAIINVNDTKNLAFNTIKNTQRIDLEQVRTSLIEKYQENDREGYKGMLQNGEGHVTQMITLNIINENERYIFNSIVTGAKVWQNDFIKGEVLKKVENLNSIIVLIYNSDTPINSNASVQIEASFTPTLR